MQILSLELTNVKNYERARYAFTPGVNAIVGPNGAGKSTIIEAIGYALFDALPYTAAEFVREGSRTGSVAVTFLSDYDERPYRVERRFGGANSYTIYDEEFQARVCDGKADVMAFIRQHLRSDASLDLARLFNDALGVAQGTLTTAFAETPARRKPIFDALLQVDDYAAAFERLREPDRNVRERISKAERDLAVFATRLEQLPPLEAAVRARAQELTDARALLAGLNAELATLQGELQRFETQRALIDTLNAQLLRAQDGVRNLAAALLRAEESLAEAEAATATVAANQQGYDAYLAAQREQETLQDAQHKRQTLLAAQAAADKDVALARSSLAQLEQVLVGIADAELVVHELAAQVEQQEHLEQQLAALEREQSRLSELDRRLVEMQRHQQQLAARKVTVAAGCQDAKALESQGHTLNADIANLRLLLDQQRSEMATVAAELKAAQEQTTQLEAVESARCPVCEQPLGAAERVQLLDRNRGRMATLRTQAAALQGAVDSGQRSLDDADKERTRLQREWARLPRQAELEEITQTLAAGTADLATAQQERAQLAAATAAAEPLRNQLLVLDDPRRRSVIAATQAAQRPATTQQVERTAAQLQIAETKIAEIERSLGELAGIDEAVKRNMHLLAQHNAAYQAVLTHRQLAESRQRRVDDAAEQARQLAEAGKGAAETERRLEEASSHFDRDQHEQIRLRERDARAEAGGLQTRIDLLHSTQAREEAAIIVLQADQAQHAVLEAEKIRLTELAEVLAAIRSVIKQAGPFVTQALVHQISEGAAQIFGELMQDHSRKLEWGEDYSIALDTSGHVRHFRQLSGGEQMSAALAVRLALVREMSELDIAFFDEPTANLDVQRREALAQQIMSIRGFTQLFVISHDDTFEQATQNIIRVPNNKEATLA